MSILLADPDETLGSAITELLLSEGDEVRVLARQAGDWKERGAFVAVGDVMDADLVERACMNVRTIVFTFPGRSIPLSVLTTAIPAAAKAGTDRVVVCAANPDDATALLLESTGLDYVVIGTGRRGFVPKKAVEPNDVARAVSAADDLAGEPRLVVDLTTDEGWARLSGHA
ncbi:MAG: NmrA-like family [Actinomycetota bacterium]|nr:NmrA-like family [Actinomycetota bacterium]